ncbi:hypothetical protein PCANC_14113, partial [Puccinia coronata f. sp. avenae]
MQSTITSFIIWLSYSLSVSSLLENTSQLESIMYRVSRVVNTHMAQHKGSSIKNFPDQRPEAYIRGFVEYSKTKPDMALETFNHLVVNGLNELDLGGKKDVGQTWKLYVVDAVPEAFREKPLLSTSQIKNKSVSNASRKKKKSPSTSGQETVRTAGNVDSFPDDSHRRLHRLAKKMKIWYTTSCEPSTDLNDLSLITERKEEMKHWEAKDLTEDAWNLLIRFLHLNIMWSEKQLIHNMVTQMAIFENFDKFPEVSDGDLALQCRRQVYAEDWNAVKQFRGWVYSHRSVDNKWVLDEAIKRIIPSPHEMSLRSFPTILNFVDHCPQEYFALITLIAQSREEAPRMKCNNPSFWIDLERIATQNKNEKVMGAYHRLCRYFEKGIPHDKTFEYFTLVSLITQEFKQLKEIETQTALEPHFANIMNETVDKTTTKNLQIREVTVKEIRSRVLQDKVYLFLNHAEELGWFMKLGNRGVFHPTLRATKPQIKEIALWVCKIFSPWGDSKTNEALRLDENFKKLNQEILSTDLPKFVKRKIGDISLRLCHMTKKYIFKLSDIDYENILWRYWDKEFLLAYNSTPFESRCDSNGNIMPFELQNDHKVFQVVWTIVDRELSSINKNNAKVLLEKLDSFDKDFHSQNLLNKIYETMNSFKKSSERNNAMEELWKNIQKLKESNPKNQAYLKKYEIEKLEDLYQKILENLDQDKNKWMERVYPLILNMSFDLRLFFDDLFEVVQKFLNLSEDNASYVESIFKTMIKEQRVSERLKINKRE